MKLEKTENYKKIIIGGLIAVGITATLILTTSKAKYKNVQSMDLASGTINYTSADIDLVAIYQQNASGEYESTSSIPTSDYTLSNNSYCNVNGEKDTSIKLSYENGLISINDITKRTKCTLYFDKIKGETIINKIISQSKGEKTSFTGIADSSDTGVYSAPDDYGTSYYFRGVENKLNNWVEFAGFYWHIIRVNGNGSIRMIYQGEATGAISSSNKTGTTTGINRTTYQYNTKWSDNTFVGYMTSKDNYEQSTSYNDAHANLYDSNAKVAIDNWYKTNIVNKAYGGKVDINTEFCNDRELSSGTFGYTGAGYGQQKSAYAPLGRLATSEDDTWKTTQTPTLQCANKNRDLFTVSTASIGNKKLTYPVGLITSDEIVFAGGLGGANNTSYYLYTNQNYWTISACIYYTAHVFSVKSDGYLGYWSLQGTLGLRPVLNLRSDTKFLGEGSESDPFVVI